jgi:flagellar biosynthesis/type III secretory pathway M-ring protein FliF/YscJ
LTAYRPVAAMGEAALAPNPSPQANSGAMNLLYAIPLLLALVVALYMFRGMVRRRALRRQKKARRARPGKPSPRSFQPLGSKRSQMRTDDDPTTVMERITETKPPADRTSKKGP